MNGCGRCAMRSRIRYSRSAATSSGWTRSTPAGSASIAGPARARFPRLRPARRPRARPVDARCPRARRHSRRRPDLAADDPAHLRLRIQSGELLVLLRPRGRAARAVRRRAQHVRCAPRLPAECDVPRTDRGRYRARLPQGVSCLAVLRHRRRLRVSRASVRRPSERGDRLSRRRRSAAAHGNRHAVRTADGGTRMAGAGPAAAERDQRRHSHSLASAAAVARARAVPRQDAPGRSAAADSPLSRSPGASPRGRSAMSDHEARP